MSNSELTGKLEAILVRYKYKGNIDTMATIEEIKTLIKEVTA